MSMKNKTKKQESIIKICPICEKPHKRKTHCCMVCDNNRRKLTTMLKSRYEVKIVSINKIMWLKEKYKTADIFSMLFKNPYLVWDKSNKKERFSLKREVREQQRSDEYRNIKYDKWSDTVPQYILNLLKQNQTKKLIGISGDRINPNIHYICSKCNKEQCQNYKDLAYGKSHNCESIISSGEAIVGEYLKGLVKIKTQFYTLKCINPITKKQLPYDFEIIDKNIIIEVQGEQHIKFIEYFHGTIGNFYYQLRKDDYKKRFAEKNGYKVVYIFYDEIKNEEYKNKINLLL